MYKRNKRIEVTDFNVNNAIQGETIEKKVQRIMHNNEGISDGAPIIYTERNEGVVPEFDIRSDRFEMAIDAMDKVHSDHISKRMERHVPKTETPESGSTDTSGAK